MLMRRASARLLTASARTRRACTPLCGAGTTITFVIVVGVGVAGAAAAVTPVPDSAAPVAISALLGRFSVADRAPAAAGAKRTPTVHDSPTASAAGQVLLATLKSAAPVIVGVPTSRSGAPGRPSLRTVTFWIAAVPVASEPKPAGVADMIATGSAPSASRPVTMKSPVDAVPPGPLTVTRLKPIGLPSTGPGGTSTSTLSGPGPGPSSGGVVSTACRNVLIRVLSAASKSHVSTPSGSH